MKAQTLLDAVASRIAPWLRCALAGACLLSLAGPAAAAEAPPAMADLDRDRIFDSLGARLRRARAADRFDVVVTFRVPLAQVNFLVIQSRMGAFAPTRPLRLVRSVATRLSRAQIEALSQAGIVEQVQADEWMYAHRASGMEYFGVTAARRELGLTGDGDGAPEEFTKQDHTIAVVDTGIDATHVELSGGKVIGWKDLINNRLEPYDDSTRTVDGVRVPLGHGTHVASIAAGRANGTRGGVAPGAALVGVKVLNGAGAAPLSTVAQGIEWCVENRETYGIRVINLSLGSSLPSFGDDVVARAVDAAVAAEITVVCSAGNSGPGLRSVGSPGASRQALTVGAAADPDEGGVYVPSWSSRGPTLDGRVKPDILAPGVGILAAKVNSADSVDQYVSYSGTSMAAPFVAGFVALMLQANPNRTPADIYAGITQTARDFGPPGPDNDFGYGLLDAEAALRPSGGSMTAPRRFPAHNLQDGTITTTARSVTHAIPIAGTDFPIAVTLFIANWFFGSPDLDVELLDPTGARVARSIGTSRQETVLFQPTQAGIYTLRVYGYRQRDRGAYFFAVSGNLGSGASPPPGQPPG